MWCGCGSRLELTEVMMLTGGFAGRLEEKAGKVTVRTGTS